MLGLTGWTRTRILLTFAGYFLVSVALSAATAWLLPYPRVWDVAFGIALFVLLMWGLWLGVMRARNPYRPPTLAVDDGGFTLTFPSRTYRFAWKDIGPFAVGTYRFDRDLGYAVFFDFDTPGHTGPYGLMRRINRLMTGHDVAIRDADGLDLDQIAATLNASRDRALGTR